MDAVELAALVQIFKTTPRQGPGDPAILDRMLHALRLPPGAKVAELGCGTGATSRHLAERHEAEVIALDLAEPFITRCKDRLAKRPLLAGSVQFLVGDMAAPPLDVGSLDLIVSEGAAYSMGFANAMALWRKLVKDTGRLVVSECVWLGTKRSPEAVAFWEQEYPAMGTVAQAITAAEEADWRLVAAERLPLSAWWHSCFDPLIMRLEELEAEPTTDKALTETVESLRREIAAMRRFGDESGYVYLAFDVPC